MLTGFEIILIVIIGCMSLESIIGEYIKYKSINSITSSQYTYEEALNLIKKSKFNKGIINIETTYEKKEKTDEKPDKD